MPPDSPLHLDLDPGAGRLALTYDDARMSADAAEALAASLAAEARDACACLVRVETTGGRSCESCADRFAARMRAQPGVLGARASFRGGVLRVDYDGGETTPERLATVVRSLGVATRAADGGGTPWRREAAFTGVALVGLVGGLLAQWQGAVAVSWALYAVAYGFGGWVGARAGLASLRERTVDIDLLMILAALGALAIGAPFEGAMLLFLFSLSNTLQHVAIGRSRRAIEALLELRPDAAHVERDGVWTDVPVEQVRVGDVFRVLPGSRLPLDGVVVAGRSSVDQAAVTGESVPVAKDVGDAVFGGTTAGDGTLDVRVTKPAGESTIARMIAMVEDAQSQKAGTQRLIDRFEQPYSLAVIGMTLAAIAVPVMGWDAAFGPAFYRAMTLMVAMSPCAVVIATPSAMLSAIAAGARRGILFKGGAAVEAAGALRAVALDKTGTLTQGAVRLSATVPLGETSESEILALAVAVQARSEHHLARATRAAAAEQGVAVPAADGFAADVGRGVRARVAGQAVWVGNARMFAGVTVEGWDGAAAHVARLQAEGRTAVVVATGDSDAALRAAGVMAFADELRPGAAAAVARLRALGIGRVALITGDNAAVAAGVGAAVGADEVHADVLPADKVALVRGLQERYGATAMVGDGVNDAPALAAAALGVAIGGAGTDAALETADLVLMGDDLALLPVAVALGRAARRTLVVNFAIAFGAIAVMVAVVLGVGLPLPLAVIGHEGSTVLVALNGLRLLAFRDR